MTPSAPAIISGTPAVLADLEAESPDQRLATWLARLGKHTSRAYTKDLGHLAAHLEVGSPGQALMALCQVRRGVAITALERYRDSMVAAGLASATVNRRLSAVNSALAELAKADMGHGRLDVRPVSHEARRETAGPSPSRVDRALDEMASHAGAGPVRDTAILLLAAQRGLRRSEIAGIRLEHLRLEDGLIQVLRKGRRELVTIGIADTTRDAIAAWVAVRSGIALPGVDALFVALDNHCRGKPLSDHGIWVIVRRIGAMLGATWHPHDLRHTAITEALRLCHGSLPAAQAFAGHAAPQTTSRYIDDKGRLERQAVAAMGDAYRRPKN